MWSASKLLWCVSLRWQWLDLVNETGSFNFSLNWKHGEDWRNQRAFPVLLSASWIMCFRNPFLGKGLPVTLKMQEGHAQSNLTFRMGEVSLTQDTWEVSWGLSAKELSSLMWNHPFLFSIHTPTRLPLYSLAEGGKFHRPELAKCLPSVWPACILKHLKSESSAHLQELQTEGLLCGKKFF